MKISDRVLLAPLALSLAAAGCSGGGGGLAISDLPQELEEEVCQAQVECGAFPDVETCRTTLFVEASEFPQLQNDVEAGLIEYDKELARECLDQLVALVSSCRISGAFSGDLEACDLAFAGTVEAGGDCTADEQCEGVGARCDNSDCSEQCCTGTCVAADQTEPAEVGEDCSSTTCVEGAYCQSDMQTGDQTCVERAAEGEPCSQFDACQAGTVCDVDFGTGEGTCIVPPDQGEECDPNSFFACDRDDNYCDSGTTTCEPRKDVGEDCEPGSCALYAYCESGTCVQRPLEGEDCNVELGPNCLGDLECEGGTCQAPGAGEICEL